MSLVTIENLPDRDFALEQVANRLPTSSRQAPNDFCVFIGRNSINPKVWFPISRILLWLSRGRSFDDALHMITVFFGNVGGNWLEDGFCIPTLPNIFPLEISNHHDAWVEFIVLIVYGTCGSQIYSVVRFFCPLGIQSVGFSASRNW